MEATESAGMGTPMQGIKALSKSVRELSSISEMSDITKSTSELLTGQTFKKAQMKKRLKALGGKTEHKSVSQSTLIHSTDDIPANDDTRSFRHSMSIVPSVVSQIEFSLISRCCELLRYRLKWVWMMVLRFYLGSGIITMFNKFYFIDKNANIDTDNLYP